MRFEINEAFVTDVSITKSWSIYRGRTDLTPEELIKVIKGEDRCTSFSSDDHPAFAELREILGEKGYISIERRWWNGDRVIKGFQLNGKWFNKGDQFPSGAAMKYHLKYK